MNSFEQQYKTYGLASQRRYPNESLLAFLAAYYFSLTQSERQKIQILELGCGSGANLWMLAREGFSVWGIDSSATGLSFCQTILNQWNVQANLTLGNMTVLPYASASFDAIVDVVSMQHLTWLQHEQALAEVFRVLKPGGRFFSFHLGAGSSAFTASQAYKLDDVTLDNIPAGYPLAGNGPTAFLSAEQYQRMANEAGLIDVIVERQLRSYALSSLMVEYLIFTARKPNVTD